MRHYTRSLSLLLWLATTGLMAATSYRIAAWNVEDMDIFDGNGFERTAAGLKKQKGIAATIRRIDPDVLLLQEAPSLIHLQYLIQAEDLPYVVAHVRQQKGRRAYADGQAVLIRKGIEHGGVYLQTPPIPDSNRAPASRYIDWSYRGIMVVHLHDVTLMGVHLKSPGSKPDRDALVKRHRQAQGLINYLPQYTGPIVVAGDFNDGPGIGDRERTLNHPDTLALFDGVLTRAVGDEPTQEGGHNIDHIMTHGASVSERTVHLVPWLLSDHRPVSAVVTLP